LPRTKKPRRASLDEVKITREGDVAVIENADPSVSTTHLTIGPQVQSMTDAEILATFNSVIASQEALLMEHDGTAIEIPVGKSQVEYDKQCDQWVPVGDVLRCIIHDNEDGQAVIWIDDHELSLRDFGRLLTTHAGWGMRIAFVPEEFIDEEPIIEVREPHDGER